ncbi:MAG: threonine/serine dehydratase [Thermoanaerobaculia bacterium]|nr:threonine/serine dehydratase [Thermoanaerobaculia bacterium]
MELEPPRRVTVEEVRYARELIHETIVRTPLVRLELDLPDREIWLKLENLQPINAFKIRGAANAVAHLSEQHRDKGVWTISAGNAGQGVAYAARAAGVPCTVVVIETAPETKVERMRRLGATLVKAPFDQCWAAMENREFPGVEGTFIHPFDDHHFIAGNATIALEVLEDLPEFDTFIAAIGGGGLISGNAAVLEELAPKITVYGAEPETAAPLAYSFQQGEPREFPGWQRSFVDGAGGKSVFPRMWDRMKNVVENSIVVTLDETRSAIRAMADRSRVIAEGAGALPVAAAIEGRAGDGTIVCVVSGGNIDPKLFAEIIQSS